MLQPKQTTTTTKVNYCKKDTDPLNPPPRPLLQTRAHLSPTTVLPLFLTHTLLPFYLTIQSFPAESRHLDVRVDFYIVYYFFLTNILNLEGYLEDTRIRNSYHQDPLLWPTTR